METKASDGILIGRDGKWSSIEDIELATEARKHNPGDKFEFKGSEYEVVKVVGRPCSKEQP